jgi:exonuclease III
MEKNIENFYDDLINVNDDFYEKIVFSLNLIPNLNYYYVSFNGGKDCLAVYILIKYKIFCVELNLDYKNKENFKKFSNEKFYTKKIILLYFVNDNNFEEEENYVVNFIKKE